MRGLTAVLAIVASLATQVASAPTARLLATSGVEVTKLEISRNLISEGGEEIAVDVCVLAKAWDYKGSALGETLTCTKYFFNLGKQVELTTLPGLPLEVDPDRFERTRDERPLREDYQFYVTPEAVEPSKVQLVLDSLADLNRKMRLMMLVGGYEYGRIEMLLTPATAVGTYEDAGVAPPHIDLTTNDQQRPVSTGSGSSAAGDSHLSSECVERTLRGILLHYYRGDTHYSSLHEMMMYLQAALVGFLSPFVLLALVFIGAAFVIGVLLHAV